jgi:hypothetical protein
MQKQKGFILPIIMVIVIVVLLGIAGYFVYKQYSAPKPIACTMEAKVCPDGSAVGRTGPNCEFVECPVVPDQTATEIPFSSQIQGVKDCGISDSIKDSVAKNVPLNKMDLEKDAALVCLGKSIADNCINAKAVLKGSRGDEGLIEISGADFASCKIKETTVKDLEHPLYINKYLECSINKLDVAGSVKIRPPTEILKNPGSYTGGLIVFLSLLFINTDQAITELGCTTNFNSADLK